MQAAHSLPLGRTPPAAPPATHQPNRSHLLAAVSTVQHLKQLHASVLKCHILPTPTFFSKLLSLAGRSSSSLRYALAVFLYHLPDRPTPLCNSLLVALSRGPHPGDTILAYRRMRAAGITLDRFSFTPLLKAAAKVESQDIAEIHGFVIKLGCWFDPFVQTALMRAYGRSVDDARRVFESMVHRDVVAWGVMLESYSQSGRYKDVLELFKAMKRSSEVKPDPMLLVPVLSACGRTRSLSIGVDVHSYIKENRAVLDDHLQSVLINMYSSCGSMEAAQSLYDEMSSPKNLVASTDMILGYAKIGKLDVARGIFDSMVQKDLVCWSAVISGYAESDQPREALILFDKMQESGVRPDQITMLSVISACCHLGAHDQALRIHDYVIENGFGGVISVNNALISMYSKCGHLQRAWSVFESISRRNVISWTSMITGLAMHGDGNAALSLYDRMEVEGIKPNGVTFVSLLYACAHSGLVDDGRQIFYSMVNDHMIQPNIEHYGCMVDLLARSKLLDEAVSLIKKMPYKPNVALWGSILGASRNLKNIEIGEYAAKQILKLDPYHAGAHVLLSNIYAKAGRWEDVQAMRSTMQTKGVLKERGRSWIEYGGHFHEFAMGEESHSISSDIYAKLKEVVKELKSAGYVPNTHDVLVNIDEEDKCEAILLHGEKLALSFGLINISEGSCIRIMKNLRVCEDCHSFMKLASLVYAREIVLRDKTRFHHFKDGTCSCKEFW